MNPGPNVIDSYFETFASQKVLAEKAFSQVSEEDLRRTLGGDTNSIAVIIKHISGNLRSRFTDFLTTDGEKPWRNRDDEFVDRYQSRGEITADWESGWAVLFAALCELTPEHLEHTVHIRGQPHTVPMALARSLAHIGYHTGQIVLTAKLLSGSNWTTITVPRGGTKEHNRTLGFER